MDVDSYGSQDDGGKRLFNKSKLNISQPETRSDAFIQI